MNRGTGGSIRTLSSANLVCLRRCVRGAAVQLPGSLGNNNSFVLHEQFLMLPRSLLEVVRHYNYCKTFSLTAIILS